MSTPLCMNQRLLMRWFLFSISFLPWKLHLKSILWHLLHGTKNKREEILLTKDMGATYCCPHCFFSFRRCYSRSHRERKRWVSRVYQTLHPFTQPSREITWPAMLIHLAGLIPYTIHFHQLLHKIKEEARSAAVLCRCMRLGFTWWSLHRTCGVNLISA